MIAKILTVDPEKRERILNAARKEFAQKGYNDASTNEIVKEAGISKGALFHYFESKKELYLFLFDHTYDILRKEFFGKINLEETDIFKRLRQTLETKLEMLLKYPETIEFMTKTYYETSEITPYVEEKMKTIMAENYAMLFNNLDTSKFRDDLDPQRAINIVLYTMEGFSMREQNKLKKFPQDKPDYEAMFVEVDMYLAMLQKCLYK
ncbi:MAG TPA: TetR/AcrR family transcriptional regulator [Ignavibacteriales bacterium]|nr:TetR/AcrR family transcriptional regulator [Ignavibacteriales bacterium]